MFMSLKQAYNDDVDIVHFIKVHSHTRCFGHQNLTHLVIIVIRSLNVVQESSTLQRSYITSMLHPRLQRMR